MASPALVPDYIGDAYRDAPPGHRFQLALGGWGRGSKPEIDKLKAIADVCSWTPVPASLSRAWHVRQQALAKALDAYHVPLRTTAPLVTGTGIEHPTENGFAFLTPYGLPYLAGSSIKGVLRHAAEELALGPVATSSGWDMLKVWRLFGFEAPTNTIPADAVDRDVAQALAAADPELIERMARALKLEERGAAFLIKLLTSNEKWFEQLQWRGALQFWDALLEPPATGLCVEVLTPHHKFYYEKAQPPADSESPVPIPFLAMPAGSSFDVVANCAPGRWPAALPPWRPLLDAALDHAIQHLGLGAKTATGYGAAERSAPAPVPPRPVAAPRPAAAPAPPARAAAPPADDPVSLVQVLLALPPDQQCAQARVVQSKLEKLGAWRPHGNPAKDKAARRTLQVLDILKNCPDHP